MLYIYRRVVSDQDKTCLIERSTCIVCENHQTTLACMLIGLLPGLYDNYEKKATIQLKGRDPVDFIMNIDDDRKLPEFGIDTTHMDVNITFYMKE